jgi:UDP-N-acetylglucosamine diphosphorylase / glucose-1-phosphate thymidylyltransferase / UDP-N-acetylgalactosamine diphosphorylase / glucosamine-1-phosphate N-acetyltransferase / galactosamine-1-phosphate N-acetyltransferase
MAGAIRIADYVASDFICGLELPPWDACSRAATIVEARFADLSASYKFIDERIAVHVTAVIEQGAILKAPCIVGEDCFVASYAYIRDGVWLDSRVAVGPSAEIKSSFICDGSRIAHLNFVGNSIIGRNVNIEAGAILANFRNERDGGEVICFDGQKSIRTGQDKFGALVGDGCRIGANAVLAPGTILARGTVVERLSLVDQAAARQ